MRLFKLLTIVTLCSSLWLFGSQSGMAAETQADNLPPLEFDDIVDRGVLRIGVKTSVVGFSFLDHVTLKYKGMENTLGKLIADKLGTKVEFVPVTAANRIDMLNSEDIDLVIATFSVTPERKKLVDFSTPYYVDNVSILVNKDSPIHSLKDLDGNTISVCLGTTSPVSLINALIDENVIEAKDFNPKKFDPNSWDKHIHFKQFSDYPSAAAALSDKKVQAFCGDHSIISFYNNENMRFLDAKFSPQEYAIACKKDRGLIPYIDDLLINWMQDGTLAKLLKENHID
ncbi:MAG: transporter substrate-binding domain-containing protein [Succinivibrio sp.]|nr:transporter substrate-binding domain-containing protein [Succinivibrio sp.]